MASRFSGLVRGIDKLRDARKEYREEEEGRLKTRASLATAGLDLQETNPGIFGFGRQLSVTQNPMNAQNDYYETAAKALTARKAYQEASGTQPMSPGQKMRHFLLSQQLGADPISGAPIPQDQLRTPRFGMGVDPIFGSYFGGGGQSAFGPPARPGAAVQPGTVPAFDTEAEAEDADLPDGTPVKIGGVDGIWRRQ